jgi:predicted DNA-binding transcriptional regulator YafY
MAKMFWRKKKTLAMLANRRQWQRDYDPLESTALEIELEQGGYLVRESSISSEPTYIITE